MKTNRISQIISMTTALLLGSMSAVQADNKGFNVEKESQHNNREHSERSSAISKKIKHVKQDDDFKRHYVTYETSPFSRTQSLDVAPGPAFVSLSEPTTWIIVGAGLVGLFSIRRNTSSHVKQY